MIEFDKKGKKDIYSSIIAVILILTVILGLFIVGNIMKKERGAAKVDAVCILSKCDCQCEKVHTLDDSACSLECSDFGIIGCSLSEDDACETEIIVMQTERFQGRLYSFPPSEGTGVYLEEENGEKSVIIVNINYSEEFQKKLLMKIDLYIDDNKNYVLQGHKVNSDDGFISKKLVISDVFEKNSLNVLISPTDQVVIPEQDYCEGLGYEYKTISENGDEVGYCFFDDQNNCRNTDFITGLCGSGYSYCEKQGGILSTIRESYGTDEYINIGRCTFKNGSVCFEWDFFNGNCTE